MTIWCKKKSSLDGENNQDLIEHKAWLNAIPKGKPPTLWNVDSTILCHVSLLAKTWGYRIQWKSCHRLSILYIIHNKFSLTRPNPEQSVSESFLSFPLGLITAIVTPFHMWQHYHYMQIFHCSCGSSSCHYWECRLLEAY